MSILTPPQPPLRRAFSVREKQRGVVLFIALIVLVALALASVGLMRSVTSGVLVAGNLALRQSTTAAADVGTAAAQTWLLAQAGTALQNDAPVSGYYSSWGVNFDAPAQPDNWWQTNARAVDVAGTPYAGWDIRYVLHRMCENANAPVDKATCVQLGKMQTGWGFSCLDPDAPCSPPKNPLYRVTTRVIGPKNTVSFVQSFVY